MKQILFLLIILQYGCTTTSKLSKYNDVDVQVILLAGQSNMAGAGNYNKLSEAEKLRVAKAALNVSLSIADQPARPLSYYIKKKSKYDFIEAFGPELFLGITLSEQHPKQKFIFIKRSVGGTSLYGAWNPNWTAEKTEAVEKEHKHKFKLYEWHIEDIQRHLKILDTNKQTYRIMGMAWFQGENDAAKEISALSYEENLKALIQGYRAQLKIPNMPFIIGQINSRYGKFRNGPEVVRTSMLKVATEDKYVDVIKTTTDRNWPDYPKHSDNVHYNTEGQRRLGVAFAERLLKLQ